MPGRTKSEVLKLREHRDAREKLMSRAVQAYQAELAKPLSTKRKSLRTICTEFQQSYLVETGKFIKLSHVTLGRLAHGGRSIRESNTSKSWLTPGETDTVIDYIIECGNCGFPLSHRRLQAHVNQILHA